MGNTLAVKKRNEPPIAHFMVPFEQNKTFIGSSQVYERLNKAGTGKHLRLALYGLGGIGYVEIFAIIFLGTEIC